MSRSWLLAAAFSQLLAPHKALATTAESIEVFVIAHSHDDTGWLKTVDQYYYGAGQKTQRAGVQYIIESVVKELASDPDKRFIQVETGFFWRWWEDKGEFMRNVTRSLVEAGQLVFTGGGWSMNDEAATHYNSIIDNMEFGTNWLVILFCSQKLFFFFSKTFLSSQKP